MSFMLVSHGEKHLHLASDEGHLFLFRVIQNAGVRLLALSKVEWIVGRQPVDSDFVLRHASSFASACAEDYGLL